MTNRVVESARGVLNDILPDIYINTDHFKGKEGGDSPGYSLSLVAETTTGALLSVERTAMTNQSNVTNSNESPKIDLPEDVGSEGERFYSTKVLFISFIHPLFTFLSHLCTYFSPI